MQAILVRIGVDQAYGGWNAPIDPTSGDFVYVPIPEGKRVQFLPRCRTTLADIKPAIERFTEPRRLSLNSIKWPSSNEPDATHLDPDFEFMTYGDVGSRRGSEIAKLAGGDMLIFYAGLRPTGPCEHRLVYAIVGVMVVDSVLSATDIPLDRRNENAHTRKLQFGSTDIVVRGRRQASGRLHRAIPVGSFRGGAYRVRPELLEAWGGLSVRDGFIQRSARPPRFLNPPKFVNWLKSQHPTLLNKNNPDSPTADISPDHRVVVVHLRRPNRANATESRDDPFWEVGSFGCTGCHRRNLMNPKRLDELHDVRLAFAQGGDLGYRLVMLTPPVTVTHYSDRGELRWKPPAMPMRYELAPLILDNSGATELPQLANLCGHANRTTRVAQFASCFRSRRRPIPAAVAAEVIRVWEAKRNEAYLATSYEQAMPYPPNLIDKHRHENYAKRIAVLSPMSSK
ncbi:MAG: hypothetical protein AAF800_06825 [Planctomycetota bacterium]